ncbi:helix-turn-helix domain-containing protein [Flagellimonas allohymeniacidonis]|uniref:AraC family transcriptional regulator n=1 Tax=Flagellimonas allohymeniacidonis TaxID=2517819 RepID=A0A4Q8QGY2_9FLAO|nr:AraC family transcriptional regulator [Allomuricauda hymeniacidonis]TAI49007.1 AraC family transcriptional regulator [Allomuricauda hymeniacidonis]
MSLSIVDFIVFLGIAQGIFLAITLPLAHKNNKSANQVLSLLLVLACAMLVARILFVRIQGLWFLKWANVPDIIIFLFGPLGHLYFRRLFIKPTQKFSLGYIHLLPAAIFCLFLVYVFVLGTEGYNSKYFSGDLFYPFMLIEGIAILLNFYYYLKILKLLIDYQKMEKQQLSFNQGAVEFTKVLMILSIILILVWGGSYLGRYILGYSLPFFNYSTIWIGLPLVIYVIGFYALKQPEIFRVQFQDKEKSENKNRLNPAEIESLKRQLDLLIEQEQVFLNNKLTLNELSAKLKTSSNNLSWLLNNIYKTSFYDFVNQFRIAAFLNKLENKEHLTKTLFTLCLEVGFNSKSTFNKAFKDLVKETPSNYIKKLKSK